MKEEWLVDGYNLLHDLKSRRKNKTSPSLQDLCALMADFASASKKVFLVLDGKGNEAEYEAWRTDSFKVIFSGKVSADTFLEKYVYENRAGTQALVVVTRDRSIGDMALGCGARVVMPQDFMERVEKSRRENEDRILRQKTKSHGFNRPFGDKLE